MASVRSIDDALNITLNTNGRVIRNLIHGADTVMSHILHFYHLSAADFVDISPASNILGSPWDDGQGGSPFGTLSDDTLVSLTTQSINAGITKELVESYVMALNMRKEAHTMGAIFSGRHPIQNAVVPGGVSTAFTGADVTDFRSRLNRVRNFINAYYIPDVVFVATRSQGKANWTKYWTVGTNPGTLLSYGEYPYTGEPFSSVTNSNLFLKRGVATYTSSVTDPTFAEFDSANIKEYVTSSFYADSTDGLHPASGVTTPLTGAALSSAMSGSTKYSWLKAPRYNGKAAEVGPLARMVMTHLSGTQKAVYETGTTPLNTYIGGSALPSGYTASNLITAALTRASAVAGVTVTVPMLFSPLGRHAARALECKYVADAMYSWLDDLSLATNLSDSFSSHTYTVSTAVSSGYSYVQIPKSASGEGLAEAPRGALGHWITIANKKIANYQCVVPSTWNASPSGNGVPGAAESVFQSLPAGVNENDAVLNIARMLHPYDFCIACAVHVVTPEGKEITKFDMGLDGSIKKH